MDLRELSERGFRVDRRRIPSSGCRVLTLQGYDIEEILYRKSLSMIGGGYFQFYGTIRFLMQ